MEVCTKEDGRLKEHPGQEETMRQGAPSETQAAEGWPVAEPGGEDRAGRLTPGSASREGDSADFEAGALATHGPPEQRGGELVM